MKEIEIFYGNKKSYLSTKTPLFEIINIELADLLLILLLEMNIITVLSWEYNQRFHTPK